MAKQILTIAVVCLISFQCLRAGDWPMFRGPMINGVAPDEVPPVSWSENLNVAWKVALPSPGNGSPIVSNGRVFVTAFEDEVGKQRSLLCFDADSGQQLWKKTVSIEKEMPTHKTNPHAPTTPASDGDRVVVWHASAGLHCYDHEGTKLWSKDLGEFRHMWGYGSSPILKDGKVILYTGPGAKVFVAVFDLKTGKQLWKVEEPQNGNGERNADNQYMGSWSTPILHETDSGTDVIVVHTTRVVAYRLKDGSIKWYCEGVGHDRGDLSYSSALIHKGICFLTGGFRGPSMSIRLGGKGNVTETHRLWRQEKQPQSIGTGVAVDGFVYRPNAGPGTLECIELATGEVRWEDRLPGTQWASIVMADGKLYATSQEARTIVFEPSPAGLKTVSENKLPGTTNSTPAIANGKIYIRTNEALWCLQN